MKVIRKPREVNPELKICFTYTLKTLFGEQLDVPVWGEWGKLDHLKKDLLWKYFKTALH